MIRPATASDYPSCSAIWAACWADGHPWYPGSLEGDRVLVAELDGEIVGFAESLPHPAERLHGWLRCLYVSPAHQREGVGKALLRDAEADLRARGYSRVVLWCLGSDARARAFYAALGYAPTGTSQREMIRGKVESLLCHARDIDRG